jgi:hypothetical protein
MRAAARGETSTCHQQQHAEEVELLLTMLQGQCKGRGLGGKGSHPPHCNIDVTNSLSSGQVEISRKCT